MRPITIIPAILIVCGFGAAAGCTTSEKQQGAPPLHVAMPANPDADARARSAVEHAVSISANRIELYLPPALYAELTCAPSTHQQTEYGTAVGRRISIKPPKEGEPAGDPARMVIGKWTLESNGPMEVLFVVDKSAAVARVRASGVARATRDGKEYKNAASVHIDDEQFSVR
ncbi:MAG: hypothetical protein HY286_06650 [Planctomycetes bacterium]|nr:hypothetical protein [Planctomycetota bacterium]